MQLQSLRPNRQQLILDFQKDRERQSHGSNVWRTMVCHITISTQLMLPFAGPPPPPNSTPYPKSLSRNRAGGSALIRLPLEIARVSTRTIQTVAFWGFLDAVPQLLVPLLKAPRRPHLGTSRTMHLRSAQLKTYRLYFRTSFRLLPIRWRT